MEANDCQKCGRRCDLTQRYCPACGAALYISLDLPDPTPTLFLRLFNSLYNLLAVPHGEPPHPKRRRYLPQLNEDVIVRRCRIEHEMFLEELPRLGRVRLGEVGTFMTLYHQALSNTLAGYACRSVEEMIFRKVIGPLDRTDKEYLISSMRKGSDLGETLYRDLHGENSVDGRLLLCLSLFWNDRHRKYILAEEKVQNEWWMTMFSESIQATEGRTISVFSQLGPARNAGLKASDREVLIENVSDDLTIG
jgi:hypothetical protein